MDSPLDEKLPGSSLAGPEPEAAQNSSGDELVFYNVMPKGKNQGSLVQPTLKANEDSQPAGKGAGLGVFLKKYKWYVIILGALLVLGPIAYFAISKIAGNSYKSESIVVSTPPKNNSPASATSTPQTAGFTTPQTWRDKYFPGCKDASVCGDSADPDLDGLTNLQEFKAGTDPNNADSDQDGLADGDEVNVFGTNPLSSHTANDQQYSDADYFKGGFDISTGKKMTPQQISQLSAKMQQYKLHQPTIKTLFDVLNSMYNFSAGGTSTTTASSTPVQTSSSSPLSGLDQSVDAEQSRDTKRSNTIQNVEIALVKYQADNKSYPVTNDFVVMFDQIKPYLKVATNPVDPVNKDPYVYSYSAEASGTDFTLSFYSEVAGQIIKKHAADAIKDSNQEQSSIYDNQRQSDLESLRLALLLYSQSNVAGNQDYVFPTTDKYKTALVPDYISQIPKDPKSGADYQYQVSATFNTFTLKAVFDAPAAGTTGYLCNQDGCQNY